MKNWQQYYIGSGSMRCRGDGRFEFRISFEDVGGVTTRKYFTGKSIEECYGKAEKFAERIAFEKESTNPDVTIVDLLEYSFAMDLKLGFVKLQGYDRNMSTLGIIRRSFLSDIPIRDVTTDQLEYFLSNITEYSYSVIKKIFRYLRVAYDLAFTKGIVKFNLMKNPEIHCPKSSLPYKKVRGLTEAEQKRFVEALSNHKTPFGRNDYRLQLLISLYSGMRMGEVNALRPGDISFEDGVVHVRRTIARGINGESFLSDSPKTDAGSRDIPINRTLEPLLRDALAQMKKNPEGLIFYDYHMNRVIPTCNVRAFYRRICMKAGIENQGCHVMRHTFATRCIESGIDPNVLKKWLGHTDIHITIDTYADVFDRMNTRAIERLDKHIDWIGGTEG